MSQILPESSYKFTELSYEEVKNAFEQGQTITGRVVKIIASKSELLVRLGHELFAHLPFSEVTIYPFQYSQNSNRHLPVNICILLNKNIRAKVIEIDDSNIILSRKQNMEQAYNYLTTCSAVMFHVTNTSTFTAYGDIGDGITARLKIRDVCRARIRNISEHIRQGDTKRVIILNSDDEKRFNVSYRKTFKAFQTDDYPEGMAVQGIVNEAVDDMCSAFFVTISPQVSGIMDVNSWNPELFYGDKVECRVTKTSSKGLHLSFMKKLE